MSISTLFKENNNFDIYAKSLNGIEGQEITGINNDGDVLTIIDKNTKTVGFVAPQGGTPETTGQPDGYVLAIKDNLTGELEWKQDAQGSIPDPLVLSGANSVNKFQVRDVFTSPTFTVNTTDSQVQIPATSTRIEGNDNTLKFAVFNNADALNPEFRVNTDEHQVSIGGPDTFNKFTVKNSSGSDRLSVNSFSGETVIQNNTDSFSVNPLTSQVVSQTSTNPSVNHILSNTSSLPSSLELVAKNDGTSEINPSSLLNISGEVSVMGSDEKGKFKVVTSAGSSILNVETFGGVGTVTVGGGSDDDAKFAVRNSSQQPTLRVDTIDDEVSVDGSFSVKNFFRAEGGTENVFVSGTNIANKFVVSSFNNEQTLRVNTASGIVQMGANNAPSLYEFNTQNGKMKINSTPSLIRPEILLQNTSAPLNTMTISSGTQSDPVCKIETTKELQILSTTGINLDSGSEPITFLADPNGDVYRFNQSLGQTATISNYSIPETIPILGGITASLLQKMDFQVGGSGDPTYVGYVARNGTKGMYNLCNNQGCGLLFDGGGGIQSTGNLTIGTDTGNINIQQSQTNPTGLIEIVQSFNNYHNFESNLQTITSPQLNLQVGGLNANVSENDISLSANGTESNISLSAEGANSNIIISRGASNTTGQINIVYDSENQHNFTDGFQLIAANVVVVEAIEQASLVSQGDIEITTNGEEGSINIRRAPLNTVGEINITHSASNKHSFTNDTQNIITDVLDVQVGAECLITSDLIDITTTGGMSFNGTCPKTSIAPDIDDSLCNKLYVDGRVGNFFAGTADTLAVNAGSIVSSGVGTLTVPANAFQIGDSFHLNMAGDCVFTGDTITVVLLAGAQNLGTVSFVTEVTSANAPWELECDFTIRTLGATGTLCSNFDLTYIGTNQETFIGSRSVEVNNINTTIANTLDVSVTFTGTDTIRTRCMYLKKVF